MIIIQCLVNRSEDDFGDTLTFGEIVTTFQRYFWFDDGHETTLDRTEGSDALRSTLNLQYLLADARVTSKSIGVLVQSQRRRARLRDSKQCTPFDELRAESLVLATTCLQIIET